MYLEIEASNGHRYRRRIVNIPAARILLKAVVDKAEKYDDALREIFNHREGESKTFATDFSQIDHDEGLLLSYKEGVPKLIEV